MVLTSSKTKQSMSFTFDMFFLILMYNVAIAELQWVFTFGIYLNIFWVVTITQYRVVFDIEFDNNFLLDLFCKSFPN